MRRIRSRGAGAGNATTASWCSKDSYRTCSPPRATTYRRVRVVQSAHQPVAKSVTPETPCVDFQQSADSQAWNEGTGTSIVWSPHRQQLDCLLDGHRRAAVDSYAG